MRTRQQKDALLRRLIKSINKTIKTINSFSHISISSESYQIPQKPDGHLTSGSFSPAQQKAVCPLGQAEDGSGVTRQSEQAARRGQVKMPDFDSLVIRPANKSAISHDN